jgi:hypothetical protein
MSGTERLAGPRRRGGRRPPEGGGAGRHALREAFGDGGAYRGRRGDECELDGTAVCLCGVLRDERHARAVGGEGARLVRVLAEHRRSHRDDDVVGGERLAQPPATRRQVSGELGVVLREAGPGAEALLPDRATELLRERDERIPRIWRIGACAYDERRRLRLLEQGSEPSDGLGIGRAGPQRPDRRGDLLPFRDRGEPVVHRHDHQRRSARGVGLVPRARERAGHVLGARGLGDRDRIIAGQPVEAPREERLLSEVPAVLLAHQHHERRPVHPSRGQRRHGVAEPGGRVHEDERGLAPGDRPPGRHAHHGSLVQAEDETHVLWQPAQEGHLRRPGVGEDGGQAALAHDLEGQVAHRSAVPR